MTAPKFPTGSINVPLTHEEASHLVTHAGGAGHANSLQITEWSTSVVVNPQTEVGNWVLNQLAQLRGLNLAKVDPIINPIKPRAI